MSNTVKKFQFQSHKLRMLTDENGEPWFIAQDVAEILGYKDTEAMTRRLDSDEVKKANLQSVGLHNNQTLINESGLYSSTLTSQKPEAKPFKRWVTHEVLPSIRKTGGYTAKASKSRLPKEKTPQDLFIKNYRFASLLHTGREQRLECANAETLKQTGIDILAAHDVKLVKDNPALKNLLAAEINGRTVQSLLDSVRDRQTDCLDCQNLLLDHYLKLVNGRLHIGNQCPLVDDRGDLQRLPGAIVNSCVWFRKSCKATIVSLYES